ncbi:hypothetical protein IFM89_018476 [Coptis chinensis]|uniref:Uncharacterized protein n=1 Tax=Coptis chinensis TaxID=261450 RepID=A0A835IPS5_9MAGN|nr:hypothetical protein IFM89_018476 [Coptis chinensis]
MALIVEGLGFGGDTSIEEYIIGPDNELHDDLEPIDEGRIKLAWQWTEREGEDGQKEGGFQKIYLHQEGVPASCRGSLVSLPGGDHPVGPAMLHPSEVVKGPKWGDLLEPGVKHALLAGIGIQILQQFSSINGVLYYTPQIFEQAGVEVILSNMGINSDSASLLISVVTTLLMLPCIAVAMRFMDISGRR